MIKILVMSSFWNEAQMINVLKNGADGCICQNFNQRELVSGIKSVWSNLKIIDKGSFELIFNTLTFKDEINSQHYYSGYPYKAKLTYKQLAILEHLARGLKEEAVAEVVGLSVNTIKYHKKKIFEKLDVECTSEALVKATKLNLIQDRTNVMGYFC